MQSSIFVSSRNIDKCRCCLAEGNHQYHYDAEMLRKCLNLIVIEDPQITMMMCSPCLCFLQEVQKFRKMVIASQKQLLSAVLHKGPAEIYIRNDPEIDSKKVKIEVNDEMDTSAVHSGNTVIPDDETGNKDESTVLKTEITENSENISDWETCDTKDIEEDIKIECEEKILKDKRKRRKYVKTAVSKKRRKRDDSESDTPIALIKKNMREEKKTTESLVESRKHTFAENSKIRSNIILILKNSTILPFRNNFKSTFKCFYCDKLYIPFKELKEHIETEHNDVCEATITKIVRSLQNLIVSAHIGCIRCKLCDEEFKTIENLVEHLCNIHKKVYHETEKKPSHGILGVDLSTDTLKCHICHKDFAFFKNLSVHMNEHYGCFVCYVCGKKFLSEHRYKSHEFKAHANKDTKCKHCGEIFKTEASMAYHVRKEHLKGMIKCLKCPETFPMGNYVKRLNHMAEAHGIKKPEFKCDTCGREYGNSGSLAAHKRYTHKRIRELRCELCGYITVHNTVMKTHMDCHNGVKNYECEFCKKRFGRPYTLKLHLKIHLNDKKFTCTLCDAAFIQKNSLKSHLKSRHPNAGIDISKL